MIEVSPEEWGDRYRARRATYESMTTRLRALITDLVHDANIDVIQVEGRTKTVDSFVEKIGRKGKKYEDPFTDMTDLVGLRIITSLETFTVIYLADGWADFARLTEKWQSIKSAALR